MIDVFSSFPPMRCMGRQSKGWPLTMGSQRVPVSHYKAQADYLLIFYRCRKILSSNARSLFEWTDCRCTKESSTGGLDWWTADNRPRWEGQTCCLCASGITPWCHTLLCAALRVSIISGVSRNEVASSRCWTMYFRCIGLCQYNIVTMSRISELFQNCRHTTRWHLGPRGRGLSMCRSASTN